MTTQAVVSSEDNSSQLQRYAMTAAALWLAVVGFSWAWNLRQLSEATIHDTISRMTSSVERTLLKTRWDQSHAGIPITFFRHDFQGDALLQKKFGTPMGSGLIVRGRLTSLAPSKTVNSPDPWEKAALEDLRTEKTEVTAVVPQKGQPQLRMLRKVEMEKACLSCHSPQQALGSNGISVSIPMEVLSLLQRRRVVLLTKSHVILAFLGLMLVILGYQGLSFSESKRLEEVRRREQVMAELQQALSEIKTLNGILPICASCKSIRDDKGYWSRVEEYVEHHSQASFTHSICPACSLKLYPEFED